MCWCCLWIVNCWMDAAWSRRHAVSHQRPATYQLQFWCQEGKCRTNSRESVFTKLASAICYSIAVVNLWIVCCSLCKTSKIVLWRQFASVTRVYGFYAPQLYRQVLLRRVLAMGILSVCLSVTTRWYTKPRWDRDSGSSPYDSPESLVSYEVIWCRWVRGFHSNEGIKEGHPPLRNRYFTTIGSSSMKTVADRHRLAAYHNKHCWRAFQWYQHRWPWTTLNPKNRGL